jgi:hypothetical protein
LVASGVEEVRPELAAASAWVGEHYHPNWHFAEALAHGIGVHHGRVPRALAQYAVRAFDEGLAKYLVCTSTLIEGVNTKAQNIVIVDNTIAQSKYDYFTFNNIRGRSGRMFQHFVGHVYLFHEPPAPTLPLIDIPAFSQSAGAPDSLLVQLEDSELTETSRERLKKYYEQPDLTMDTIRENVGVDPQLQLNVAKEIESDLEMAHVHLAWSGYPSNAQLAYVSDMIWRHFDGRRVGAASALSAKQLATMIGQLRHAPTAKELIAARLAYKNDPDAAVQSILDFQRLWAMFNFPRLLRALDRIQRDVFRRRKLPVGSFEAFASRVECLFLDPSTIALDEYGIPQELARKIESHLQADGDIDTALARLSVLDVAKLNLNEFERDLIRYAISGLAKSDRQSPADA